MKDLSVILGYQPDPEDLAYLRTLLLPNVKLSIVDQPPKRGTLDFEILVHGRPNEHWITASDHLRAVVIPFSGLPQSTADLLSGYPNLRIYNIHHNAVPVAELAMALLLAAARRIVKLDRQLRLHDWSLRYQGSESSYSLFGRRVLVLGYGHVGQQVAQICRAMGMQVRAIKRTPSNQPADIEISAVDALPTLLPWAQVLILCLPYTRETKGIIDAEKIKMLPEDSILINVGRGEVVDEGALYKALVDGSIAAAGLDVWFKYPLMTDERPSTPPSAYAFNELDNVVMTPHVAGKVTSTEKLRMEHLAALLNDLAEGKQPLSEIDLDRGY